MAGYPRPLVRRSQWRTPVIAACSLLTVAVAGCSSSSPSSSSSSSISSSSSPGSSSSSSGSSSSSSGLSAGGASGTAASSAGGGTHTLTVWGWDPSDDSAKPFEQAFKASHPGYTLNYKSFQYADYSNALRLGLTSGSGPDVFELQSGAITTNYGRFAEDLSPLAEKAHGSDWKSGLITAGMDQLQFGGKQVGMPLYEAGAGLVWYNKNIFDKYGLQPPKTFEDLISVSKTLTSHGVLPVAHGGKDAWVNEDVFIAIANEVAPGKIYDAIAGKASWTDPGLVKAMDYYHQLYTDGAFEKGSLGLGQYPDAENQFVGGKAGMVIMGTWHDSVMTKTDLATRQKAVNVNQPFTALPIPFPSINGVHTKLFGSPNGWAIAQKSKDKDAAWAWVDWFSLQKDGGQVQEAAALNQPVLKSVPLSTTGLVDPATQAPALSGQAAQLSDPAGIRSIPYGDLDTAVGAALSAVAAGTQSSSTALGTVDGVSKSVDRQGG